MAQFGERLAISGSAVSLIELGTTNPTDRIIKNICSEYTDLNPDWLETGEGDMLLPEPEEDAVLFAKFLKMGKGRATVDALRVVFNMYISLDETQRRAWDQMVLDAVAKMKKDPE